MTHFTTMTAELKASAERDRVARQRGRLRAIAHGAGGPLVPMMDLIHAALPPAPPIERKRDLVARLEAIDHELHALLAGEAPTVYAELRQPIVQLMRRARRAIRALERAP